MVYSVDGVLRTVAFSVVYSNSFAHCVLFAVHSNFGALDTTVYSAVCSINHGPLDHYLAAVSLLRDVPLDNIVLFVVCSLDIRLQKRQ